MAPEVSVEKRFSKAAGYYSEFSLPQQQAASELVEWLPSDAVQIIELGCGTGLFTEKIVQRFSKSKIIAVDFSSEMLLQAKSALPEYSQIKFVQCDALTFNFPNTADVVTANCAFQWMTPLEKLFAHCRNLLGANGRLVFSVMLKGSLAELHKIRREVNSKKLPKQELPAAEQIFRTLEASGFSLDRWSFQEFVAFYPSATEFLKIIHLLGFTGGKLSGNGELLTRGELVALTDLYTRRFKVDQGVKATYCVGYFSASKKVEL